MIKGLGSVMKRTHIENSTESKEVTYPPIVEKRTLTVVPKLFAKRNHIQAYNFVGEPHKRILTQVNWHLLLSCKTKSVRQILEVLLKNY